MKKTVIILSIIILVLVINKSNNRIPNESIRFRVIASNNETNSQEIKKKVVENLKSNLINTNNSTNIVETRKYIQENLPLYTKIVDKTLKDNNYKGDFHINYGKNYFPEKTYNNEIYPEGEYESLVVTLGEGNGDNFWCVLFPPLCFEEKEDYHYKSFIKEIFNNMFE
jgi:stage II sporulation protein R